MFSSKMEALEEASRRQIGTRKDLKAGKIKEAENQKK